MKPFALSLYLVTTAWVLSFLSGCSRTPSQQLKAATTRNPLEITPGPELQKRIKVGAPRVQPVAGSIQVAGRVEANETRLARISAPVTGRIIELNAVEGQQVRRGQLLARIFSTELSSAQSEFLKAHSQYQAGERGVARARMLLKADVIGAAELQRRESELSQAGADLAAALERLRVLGLNEENIRTLQADRKLSSASDIVATIDGTVMERTATIGQLVQAVETVFVVADLSSIWLVADVPEQNAQSLQIGTTVRGEIPALPTDKINGRISFVSAIVNPETRTVRTRMDLPNPRGRYKPSMLANLTLVDGTTDQIVIPASAVVRENNEDFVFVAKGPNTFVLSRVTLGDDSSDVRVVLEGLNRKDQIITEGAFHLNNERKRQLLGDDSES